MPQPGCQRTPGDQLHNTWARSVRRRAQHQRTAEEVESAEYGHICAWLAMRALETDAAHSMKHSTRRSPLGVSATGHADSDRTEVHGHGPKADIERHGGQQASTIVKCARR